MRNLAYLLACIFLVGIVLFQKKQIANFQQQDIQAEISPKAPIPESGCSIQLVTENKGNLPLSLQIIESSVRVEYGKWNSLYYNIGGGALCSNSVINLPKSFSKKTCTCQFALDCSIPRQYRFQLVQTNNEGQEENYELFFPSDSTFTTQNKILLQIKPEELTQL